MLEKTKTLHHVFANRRLVRVCILYSVQESQLIWNRVACRLTQCIVAQQQMGEPKDARFYIQNTYVHKVQSTYLGKSPSPLHSSLPSIATPPIMINDPNGLAQREQGTRCKLLTCTGRSTPFIHGKLFVDMYIYRYSAQVHMYASCAYDLLEIVGLTSLGDIG